MICAFGEDVSVIGRRPELKLLCVAAVSAAVAVPAVAGDEAMTFRAGCVAGERIIVASVGDLLFHNSLQRQALRQRVDWPQI